MSTHQPKAGLCMACAKRQHDCSGLPFETMPVLHTYSDGVKSVKCTSYTPQRPPPLMRVRVSARDEKDWLKNKQ